MSHWTAKDIPDLQGYTVIVTGANSGLGLQTTRAIAAKRAHVIMACRNLEKGQQALNSVEAQIPGASVELAELDLASLESVRLFVAKFREKQTQLNLLFNNAGVMAIPRAETKDGFEMQFGTNHLAHYALTGLLLPTLLATPHSRVVNTTSFARKFGKINFDDLNRTQKYGRWEAYGQSKQANLLFTFELQRRLAEAHAQTISVAAHPGYANTNLQATSVNTSSARLEGFFYAIGGTWMAQSAQMGALPQLFAGISPEIHGGELVGPSSMGGMRGYPHIETKAQKEYDREKAARLWRVSAELTGVDYDTALQIHPNAQIS
ncbi:MAG TPA: oxidoreductase [Ktedonobacteraceae bacterium]|nr:oxidoreductase [Ktedonobacteraceae bacterium]